MKELKKAAKEKKRDSDSKLKGMEQRLEKVTNLVQNLSTTGLTGSAPAMASHPAPTSSAAPASTPYGVPHTPAPQAFTGSLPAFTGNPGIPPTGITSPIGFNLGAEGGESSSERSVVSVGTVGNIDGEARTTVKERSIALKKKGKEKKENEVKMKEKQKKLKEIRYHQVQSTLLVQPTVDQTLLAAANAQAQAMGGAAVNPVFVNAFGTSAGLNLNHLLNPLHMRLRGSVMKQPKFSGHPSYWASFERQFMVWLQTEKLDKELWILCLMDCLTGKLRESTYNLYVERQNQGDPLTYEELWRTLKKEGSRLPEDHYTNRLENFRAINKLFLEEIQIARQDWKFLVEEAESAGEGLSEGEMKKILLSKVTPETKQKIRDPPADTKVLGNWVEVRGLPETMGKMPVRELLNSISAIGLRDIPPREGRWRVEFHDSKQAEFFCNMVDGKVKSKRTVLKVQPWMFSYRVEQIWDQLEKYANARSPRMRKDSEARSVLLVRRDAPCAFPFEKKVGRRLTRPQTTDGRPQISKQLSPKSTEREIPPEIPPRMEREMPTNMDGERVKGSPKERTEIGHPKITRSRAEIQVAQDGPKLVENLVDNLVKRVEKDNVSPGIKKIPK